MNSIVKAFEQSLLSLFSFRMWLRILLPLFIISIFFFGLAFLFWKPMLVLIQTFLVGSFLVAWLAMPFSWFAHNPNELALTILSTVILIMTFVILFYLIQVVLVSQFLIKMISPYIQSKYKIVLNSDSVDELHKFSIVRFLKTVSIYLLGLFISFPFWIVPGLPFFISAILNGYLASQILPDEILEKKLSQNQFQKFMHEHKSSHFGLGVLGSLTFYIPIFNFFAPVFLCLLFMHYDYDQLASMSLQLDSNSSLSDLDS